jgi:hypothetical protein
MDLQQFKGWLFCPHCNAHKLNFGSANIVLESMFDDSQQGNALNRKFEQTVVCVECRRAWMVKYQAVLMSQKEIELP